ncbi:hypothetical protein BH09ACT12_BH09ACT12_19790 [soil metagenome]
MRVRSSLHALLACALTLGGALAASVTVAAPATAASADIRINEVESSGGTPGDWVELVNPTNAAIDASGLKLKDDDDTHAFVVVPSATIIPAKGFVAVDVDVTGGFGLGGADTARLFAADGTTLLDSYSWAAHATTTYGRCPDGTGAFVTTVASTKGAANNCPVVTPPANPIKFNEVESNGDPTGDWAEVVNTGASTVDLSGYRFKDDNDSHAFYTVASNTTLAPGGYYVFNEADFGFGLGSPDSVRLFAPAGGPSGDTAIETYSWQAHAATTYGRCPDATGPFTTTTSSTKDAANDCSSPVRINEVESSGGSPGDWVELINNGVGPQDVSGYVLKDADDTHAYPIPADTTIAAGDYLVLDEADFGFGLGSGDSARLFAADGTTLVDSYVWAAHASTTYGRCPNGTGDFTTTQAPTKGAANSCPGDLVTGPWPGGADVATSDVAGTFSSNLSGLMYEGTGTATPGTLWAVRNGPGALFKLERDGDVWTPAPGAWANGKLLHYPDGAGDVDAEGVTFTAAGPAAGIYVASERNNTDSSVSRPAIERYDPTVSAAELNATKDWNLSADLPGLGANLGLEGIAWIPDEFLTSRGFYDEARSAAYDPAAYPGHGAGLFLVGVEATGRVYAYALDQNSNDYTRVASFASGFTSVMELHFEVETQKLWVVCDDTCAGRSSRFDIDTVPGSPTQGRFVAGTYYERPAGMPNLNNEGFTTTPQTECVDGLKPVFWADDSSTAGHALRSGTVNCTSPASSSFEVSGAVSSADGPTDGACVYLYTGRSAPSASYASCTVADGSFLVGHVSPGSYVVAVSDPSGRYATRWLDEPISVDGDVSGLAVSLTPVATGFVTGTVNEAGTGTPLTQVCVYAYPHGVNDAAAYATCADASGHYGLFEMAAGSYDLAFADPSGSHPTRWFSGSAGGAAAQGGATEVVVASGGSTGVDIALPAQTSGALRGTVTNPQGEPVAGVCVYLYTSEPGPASYGTCSQADGTWYLGVVDAGSYQVGFADPQSRFVTQWWTGATGGSPTYSGGGQVTVAGGTLTSDVDALMGPIG